jgi:hypothetical protein
VALFASSSVVISTDPMIDTLLKMRRCGMYYYKITKIIITVILLTSIFTLTLIIPIKFCLKSLPSDDNKDFYIIRFYDLRHKWFLVGDKNGMYDENTVSDYVVYIEGKNPQKIVSRDLYLCDRKTYFIIYGIAKIDEMSFEVEGSGRTLVDKRYTIYSTGWDILNEIDSRNSFRLKFSRKYLTLYDYKWFDYLRKLFGVFDD